MLECYNVRINRFLQIDSVDMSFSAQLLGCIVIGYMAWVLATSVTVAR